MLFSNDDWEIQDQNCINAVAATSRAPLFFLEPAFVVDLPAGSYTAVVSGVSSAVTSQITGIALPSVTKVFVGGTCVTFFNP